MSRHLVIEWRRAGIRGLDAEVTGKVVKVRASFAHAWPAVLDAANDPEGVGLWLKAQLRELGAGDRKLIVLVSREEFVLRLLALPQASDDTLPELVRYQTGARSSVPLDQLVVDYLPLVAAPPQGGRWVQTATVPEQWLRRIKACAKVAGLELIGVGAATVALGEAIARGEALRHLPADAKRLVVRIVDQQLEVALWRGSDLLFSHTARAAQSNAVSIEVQRALMSHEVVAGRDEIARVWLIAPPEREAELRAGLAARCGCEVVTFDATRDVQVRGLDTDAAPDAACLGALLAIVEPTVPAIDFLNPRRRVVKPARTNRNIAAAVIALFVFLSMVYLASRLYSNSLLEQIAKRENLIRQQEKILRAGEPTRETVLFLSAWESRRVDWLDQMVRIGTELPGTDRIYLDNWRFDLASGEPLGTTEATAFARDRQDAERWTQRIAERAGFRVRPNPIGSAGNDPDYPILFQLDAEVVAPPRRPARSGSE